MEGIDGLADCDIFVVGLGINGLNQLTREAEAALRRCEEILFIAASPTVEVELKALCPRVTNLYSSTYRDGAPRLAAYDEMASRVLEAALDHAPVAFAVYGHPLMFAFPPQQIARASEFLKLRTRILPGISSLDTMLVDLGLDPGILGLQIYEATEILVRKRPLQPDVPCLLWQVGAVETNMFSLAGNKPGRFTRIRDYLLQYYPAHHQVAAVHSQIDHRLASEVHWFTLADLQSKYADLHQGLTLYLPPVSIRPIMDEELCSQLESVDHLRTITAGGD